METTQLSFNLLGFFLVMNNDLFVDFEACICCNVLFVIFKNQIIFCPKSSNLKTSWLNTIKLMGLFPLKIHVDFIHPKLFVEIKL